MRKCGTVTIETDRLILRKMLLSDAEDMFKNYCNDEEVAKYLPWAPHKNLKTTKKYIKSIHLRYRKEKENSYHWVIVLKEINEVIGAIDFNKFNTNDLNCELGYCMCKKYWNKGIMTEAAKAIVKYLFETRNIERIWACHVVENVGSGKVMQKIGMIKEGTFRKNKNVKGVLMDFDYYSLLRSDYEK